MTMPGKIESIKDGQATIQNKPDKALVDLGLVSDAKPGEWVLYHANRAVKLITEAEAKEINELMVSIQPHDRS